MSVAVTIIVFLAAVVLLGVLRRDSRAAEAKPSDCGQTECSSCGADDRGCSRERLLKAAADPIEYFDDEELDRYAGRAGDSYNAEETDQFAYVLHTMRPDEAGAWTLSLEKRGISVPDELRDELLMMIEDGHT